ncbi:MAG: tRNA (adenosine(37)-N6)-dimethylallyltransferase MiaA [Austwickia sp.]|nr:tRNA (adenosine(37)-N6)-dimethylallyltransferase MiaA [Austwickia sp.]MBK8435037.1 tRNA (adenosine(37)-N6)-dimethylallyltransferase MiaA [Austwickia sp.]MBK9101408.1 tRNA (adenosine(37)-N6)-dimethylallyltransferase MiaA [Austwickia sp.]
MVSSLPVVAIVGPTATGKSELALALARAADGEVVNADASQLYRGMDIGTAKVPVDQRQDVPHHQLDVLDIQQEASVAAYQRCARADLGAISAGGRLPILAGGSGLYVRAALDRLDIPPTDPGLRASLERELADRGLDVLRQRLERADPAAARVIDAHNARRIVRALEVIELTGRPFSATMPTRDFIGPTVLVGLRCERAVLDERIARRTRGMWAAGLLAEVEQLVGAGLAQTRTAARAVGYPQAMAQLRGDCTQDDAVEATVAATRRLVRRQESWFGADPRVHWLQAPATPDDLPALVSRIHQLLDASTGDGTLGG